MDDLKQWVNVERKKAFVEDDVTSEERLGPNVHFECTFKKAKAAHFKVRVVPQSSPAAYTNKERGRNPNFRLRESAIVAKPEGKTDVKLATERTLPCAGGNRYLIEAKYKDKIVQSKMVLAARRRLFYQVLTMQGLTPQSTATLEADFWNEPKHFFLDLKEKGPRSTIKLLKTLHDENTGLTSQNDFIFAAKAGYTIESRRPYALTIVFSNFIADWDKDWFVHSEDVTLPSKIVACLQEPSGAPTKVRMELPRYAWWEMDPAHDAARFWLLRNRTKFVAADGAIIPIADSDLSIVGPPDYSKGGYHWLEVSLSPVLRNRLTERKGKLKVDIEYRYVAGWSLGFSYRDVNLVTAAKYAEWEPVPAEQLEQTLTHEVGHKIGMVATGQRFLPSAPSTYYQDSFACNYGGHRGPHCRKGATYLPRADEWTGAPGCVMFGDDKTPQGSSPKTFCDECAKIVRKLDLDPRHLDGFKRSVKDY